MSDPLEPLTNIAKRLQEESAKIGLDLQGFAVVPSMDGSPHAVQAMFVLADVNAAAAAAGATPKTAEEIEFDKQFEDLIRGQKKAEEEEKFEASARAAEELARKLLGGDLGEDGDDEPGSDG